MRSASRDLDVPLERCIVADGILICIVNLLLVECLLFPKHLFTRAVSAGLLLSSGVHCEDSTGPQNVVDV